MIDGLLFEADLPEEREEPPAAAGPNEPPSVAALCQQLFRLAIDANSAAASSDASGDL